MAANSAQRFNSTLNGHNQRFLMQKKLEIIAKNIEIIWRRANFQDNFVSAIFVQLAVKDNRNELEYAKSAVSNDLKTYEN